MNENANSVRPEEMTFGAAIEHLKNGKKICRRGWHGKGMYVFLREGETAKGGWYEPEMILKLPGIGMYQPGWNASTADVLAIDWEVFEDAR